MAGDLHQGREAPRDPVGPRRVEGEPFVDTCGGATLALRMSANLVRHGDIRYGRTIHISFDGVAMVFDGPVPVTVNQHIRLGLMTGACVFELRGTVEAIRETGGSSGIPGEVSSSDIAVKFDPIASLEKQVLGSLLDAFRDHGLTVGMTTLVVAEDAGDILLEAGSLSPSRTHADPFPFSLQSRREGLPLSSVWDEVSSTTGLAGLPPPADVEDRDFWADYLDHFHFILNVPEYWELLDRICRLMGEITGETLILDAGCGQGNLGEFLMIDRAYRNVRRYEGELRAPQYVGMDFVTAALEETRQKFYQRTLEVSLRRPLPFGDAPNLRTALCCADLNRPLPFQDGRFDRVACNLVLSYLHDPIFSLQELMRVLAPAGRLILSILKPVADPLRVYRDILEKLDRGEDRAEVRWMLKNWSSIQLVEYLAGKRVGDERDFQNLILSSGASTVRVYSALADQALLALVEKPFA